MLSHSLQNVWINILQYLLFKIVKYLEKEKQEMSSCLQISRY